MKLHRIFHLILAISVVGTSFLGAESVCATQAKKRLNIISIVTDDQARWAVGAYGNKEVKTPNMDRLAREGAKFINAFVPTPVCSPSRASFLTGLYGTQVGITDYIAPVESDAGMGLDRRVETWIRVLKNNGYITGLIGKWHLGTQPQFHPSKHGIDHFFGFLGGGNRPMNPTLNVGGKKKKFKGSLPDILVDDAIGFLKKNRNGPFALMLHFRAPHAPYGPVAGQDSTPLKSLDPTIPKVKGLDITQVKKWTRDYYASVHSIDRNLGRLLKAVDDLGLADNTIILFTSDHGYMIGHHGLRHKGNAHWIIGGYRGPKRPNMFSLSVRVPLIIRWPGVVRPGTEIEEMVSNIDTFPSVLGMLDVPMPAGVKRKGRDFSPLLRGKKVPWRTEIYGQYDLHNNGLAFMRMIRTKRYALIRHHFSNYMDELYDLKNDPGEKKNLYRNPKYRQIRERLQRQLSAWQHSINDPLFRGIRISPTASAKSASHP